MAENKDKRELENIDTVEDATKENTDEKKDEYEEICFKILKHCFYYNSSRF